VRRDELPVGPVRVDTGVVELVRSGSSPAGVTLVLNGMESSYLDLTDPRWLEFEYMQQMREVLDAAIDVGSPVRALHLGAAGCALPRALDALRPGSRQIAVEIDNALATLVRLWFDLPRAPALRIRVDDARRVVGDVAAASQDVVVRDAFSGGEVPGHLRTLEFARTVDRALRPGGVYLANAADHPPLLTTRREAATLAEVFPNTGLIADPGILRGRRYGNLVLVASRRPLPVAPLARALRALPQPASLLVDEDVERFHRGARPFTDDGFRLNGEGPTPSG
jgi:spermidine synthase